MLINLVTNIYWVSTLGQLLLCAADTVVSKRWSVHEIIV